jgi:hypothetical protein
METSPGSDNFALNILLSIAHFAWGGRFPDYLPIITLYTFYCSNMLLSIAYFTWGRVIIYDDNLSYRNLSLTKRNIYIYLNETHPEQFALRLHEAFWDLRITRLSQLHRHI